MPMTPKNWSISGLSTETGLDRRTVAKYVQNLSPVAQRGKVLLYRMADLFAAVAMVALPDGRHKTRLLKARADIAEHEAKRLAGSLVPVADVGRVWAEAVTLMRTHMLAVPHKVAPLVAVETDVDTCFALIQDRIHEALQELSETEVIIEPPDDQPGDATD